jgi:uncharacterized membrane protein (Fun14 family)
MSALLYGLRRGTGLFKPTSKATTFLRFTTQAPSGAAVKTSAVALVSRRGARRVGTLIIMSTMGLAYFQLDSPALCSSSGSGGDGGDLPSPMDLIAKVLEKYQGEINEMGVSGIAGFCSGYCLKRISQEVAVGIGAVFMLLQVLQHQGYININYKKMSDDVSKVSCFLIFFLSLLPFLPCLLPLHYLF